MERVEIVKGPASALYGNEAIEGVFSFITKDPEDYLEQLKQEPFWQNLKATQQDQVYVFDYYS